MSEIRVEADIHIEGDGGDSYGGSILLKRTRGNKLISISAHGVGPWGYGPVDVDPAKLRDALDKLVAEDLVDDV